MNAEVRKKILVVDDEPQIRNLLTQFLSEQFEVEVASSGNEALRKISVSRPNLVVMDIKMPDMDGITAVKKIREIEAMRHIPVLMLTAVNTTSDRIRAFNLGADDYISKPFEFEEVLARIQSKLNRVEDILMAPKDVVVFENLILNTNAKTVTVEGRVLDLSPVEYGIIDLLLRKPGDVISRKEIMDRVWRDENKSDRLIDAHLTSLRKKLSEFRGEIQTVYGLGYKIIK